MALGKVLVVTEKYPPFIDGGYELACYDVVQELIARGVEVTVLTSDYTNGGAPEDYSPDNGKVLRKLRAIQFTERDFTKHFVRTMLRRAWLCAVNYWTTKCICNQAEYDLALAFKTDVTSFSPLVAVTRSELPLVVDVGDDWVARNIRSAKVRGFNRLKRLLGHAGFDFNDIRFDHFIANSNRTKEFLSDSRGSESDISVINCFLPNINFTTGKDAGFPNIDKGLRLINGGRLCDEKGSDLFIEVAHLLTSVHDIAVEAHLYGSGDERYVSRLRQMIMDLGLQGTVFLHGMLSERKFINRMCECHMLIFPFRWEEPFGRVVSQAMATGTLPICTRRGGPAEMITHGVDGLLVDECKPELFAEAIRKLVASPEHYTRLRQGAIKSAKSKFPRDRMAETYISILEKTLMKYGNYRI